MIRKKKISVFLSAGSAGVVAAVVLLFAAVEIPFYQTVSSAVALQAVNEPLRDSGQTRLHALDGLPLFFEPNEGQADAHVDFIFRGRGYTVFLSPDELELRAFHDGKAVRPRMSDPFSVPPSVPASEPRVAKARIKVAGANARVLGAGTDKLPGYVNYFIGDDRSKWRTNVPTYAGVRYSEILSGIDLVYYVNEQQLEFDFVVAPGADPQTIGLEFEAVDGVDQLDTGDLVWRAAGEPIIILHKPSAYQLFDGVRREVTSGYKIDGRMISFQIDGYDRTRPLIVDPVLRYATRFPGRGEDGGYAIAVDGAGSVYVTGNTSAVDFPVVKPAQRSSGGSTDVFVAKLNADGSGFAYATYLGGGGVDTGYGIAVDASGDVYVTGDTRSADFPLVNPLQSKLAGFSDIFLAKLSADGARLLYSTYFGESGSETGLSVAVDPSGNAYVAGFTNSTDFPTVNAFQGAFAGGNADAFVLKVSSTGPRVVYSTYLGGGNDRPDIATAIAADAAGNAYVTGYTNSPDFPTFKPLQRFVGPTDVFVTKLNPTGSALVFSTHLGGKADDEAMAIAVDSQGNVYVAGETESPDFPTTAGAFKTSCPAIDAKINVGNICSGGDAFVSKLNPDGASLVYSTFLYGRRFEVARSIAVDSAGAAYVTGITSSPDFPTVNPIQEKYGGGDYDAFVVKIDPSGSALSYSTFLGGSGEDGGYGVAIDNRGNAYVTGITSSPNFPIRNPLPKVRSTASRDLTRAFIVKIGD